MEVSLFLSKGIVLMVQLQLVCAVFCFMVYWSNLSSLKKKLNKIKKNCLPCEEKQTKIMDDAIFKKIKKKIAWMTLSFALLSLCFLVTLVLFLIIAQRS